MVNMQTREDRQLFLTPLATPPAPRYLYRYTKSLRSFFKRFLICRIIRHPPPRAADIKRARVSAARHKTLS